MLCREGVEHVQAERTAAMHECDATRHDATRGDLAGEALDGAIRNGQENGGARSGAQRPNERRDAMTRRCQQNAAAGTPERSSEAPAQVAPARDDDVQGRLLGG